MLYAFGDERVMQGFSKLPGLTMRTFQRGMLRITLDGCGRCTKSRAPRSASPLHRNGSWIRGHTIASPPANCKRPRIRNRRLTITCPEVPSFPRRRLRWGLAPA